jgi:hypothetical protein
MGCPPLSFGVDLRTLYKSRHYKQARQLYQHDESQYA